MFRSRVQVSGLSRSLHTSRLNFAETPAKSNSGVANYASKALEQSQKVARTIGHTTGRLLSLAGPRVQGLVARVGGLQKPIVYWGKVGGEIAKQGPHFPVQGANGSVLEGGDDAPDWKTVCGDVGGDGTDRCEAG
jgi:hypothetical protein